MKFSKKLLKLIAKHQILVVLLFVSILFLVLSIVPPNVGQNLCICLLISYFIIMPIYFFMYYKEKKKCTSYTIEDYEKKYKLYVNMVYDVAQNRNLQEYFPKERWLKLFNTCMNITIPSINNRNFDDIDIAACLVFALVLAFGNSCIPFAFECVKVIISEPKDYIVTHFFGNEFELIENKKFEKVYIDFSVNSFSLAELEYQVKLSMRQKSEEGILELSNFFRFLYLCSKH